MSSSRIIRIEVQQGDVLDFPADALVLKYAQALYGADLAVYQYLEEAGRKPATLPRTGEVELIHTRGLLKPELVLFVGVVPLLRLGYRQIREFGYRALASLVNQALRVEHVALTIHGPGYGLDEVEAFESELAGVVNAISARDCPANLRRVSFVERNPGRAERLREVLHDLIPGGAISHSGSQALDRLTEQPKNKLRTAGYTSAEKPRAFVAMPFADSMDDVFHYGIQGPVNSAGFLCERADLASFVGDVMEWVRQRIASAEVVIAELSTPNPNVYLEVGFAWGCGRPTILLTRDAATLPFNARNQKCIEYKSIKQLEEMLRKELEAIAAPPDQEQ